MKFSLAVLAILGVAASVNSQGMSTPGMNMNMNNMNYNLSTIPGILGFLRMENINASALVTSNCIANGNPCSPSGGQQCCLSPVFACMPMGGQSSCMVVTEHVNHLAQIRQIASTVGITTQNPIL